MTTPIERTVTVIAARRFLYDLKCDASLPHDLRKRGSGLLRHYPRASEVLLLAKKEGAFQGMKSGPGWCLFAEEHRDFDKYLKELLEADSEIRV